MVIVKVLKRKDASSVMIAVVLALALSQMLQFALGQASYELAMVDNSPYSSEGYGPDWKQNYLVPVIQFLLTVLVLEVVLRLFIAFREFWIKNR